MQPVICFHENDKLIHSLDYQLISCPDDQDAKSFLQMIETTYAKAMKVVKINFAAFDSLTAQDQRKQLVKTPKVQVFVLNSFDLISQTDLEKLYPEKISIQPAYRPTVLEKTFLENVQSIKEDIGQGRFYQINYTAALEALAPEGFNLLSSYVHMANVGGNYHAYLPLGIDESIHCLSPELFIRKKGLKLITQPIKGTLLLGRDVSELENSTKENAELSMIVDLLRNDLNTLSCEKYNDSSRVNFHRQILDLQYTTHTYSEVEINTSKKFSEIIAKTFPGGSISGCPKKESLKKITEIENYHRDFYTGTMGWWQGEDFCMNIAIRSSYQKKNKLYYFTGCGIVFDSDPRAEWREFLTKCSFLNLNLEYTPIVDTLAFDGMGFTYLAEHIERTHLAFQNQMLHFEIDKIQKIYQKIETELRSEIKNLSKVRIIFTKDLNYKIEVTAVPVSIDPVSLQLVSCQEILPQFKTLERAVWDKLLENKNPKADDVLVVNKSGHVVETSIYSLFYKMNDQFFTVPLSDGGLHSVFQSYHLKSGVITVDGQTYNLTQRSLPASEIQFVDLYVGNSVRGLKKAELLL